jgi:hypothetical protein
MAKRKGNKPPSHAQIRAIERNWAIFRLKGIVSNLRDISNTMINLGIKEGSIHFGCAQGDLIDIISILKEANI